jgi:hypothetical protein
MEFRKVFINMALLGLAILSMLSFVIIFQADNNASEKIIDNEIINKTYYDLYGNLSTSQSIASQQNNIFGEVKPTESYGELQVDSVVSPTKAFKSFLLGVYNILIKLPSQFLGISTIVTAIITAILIISLIVGIWLLWKGVR